MTRLRLDARITDTIAWLGLALLIASFVVLVLQPQPAPSARIERHRHAEPFALVVLDPGHGGADSGAMAGAVSEKDLTLDIARRVERLLAARGVATLMTRVGDSYVALADRAALANRAEDAIFISIHLNDGARPGASGVETYFASRQTDGRPRLASWFPFLQSMEEPNVQSQSLAGFIQQELVGQTHASNRGTKAEQFFVLANVRHPAVLVEGGFLTNRDDVTKLGDANYREQLGTAISSGIFKYRETLKQRPVER
ncbi:MAG: N-acetylmuramoyl-L-alanine amidase family protein [Chthoniobacterales bacterium]